MVYTNLNLDKALIWRITHRRNLPWILANGLHAGNMPGSLADLGNHRQRRPDQSPGAS